MTKTEFKGLFEQALEIAACNAERILGKPVPRTFEIEMHGLAPRSRVMTKEKALEEIFLDPDVFYQIIDLSVHKVSKKASTVFLRVSGHVPGPFSQTWNQPSGSGPFKQLLADRIVED